MVLGGGGGGRFYNNIPRRRRRRRRRNPIIIDIHFPMGRWVYASSSSSIINHQSFHFIKSMTPNNDTICVIIHPSLPPSLNTIIQSH